MVAVEKGYAIPRGKAVALQSWVYFAGVVQHNVMVKGWDGGRQGQ